MVGKTLDLTTVVGEDGLAVAIAEKFTSWNNNRASWLAEKRELRDYVFATDTSKTTNASLPWKNTTVTPKLCQIRDNLHANYMAALFPHKDWLHWEGNSPEAETFKKRQVVQDYMRNKLKQSRFRTTVSELLFDYIDYGNCFATTEWVNESKEDPITGERIQGYVGPRLVRISPNDIVFNPTAATFKESPKIVRSIKTLGEIKKQAEQTDDEVSRELLNKALSRAQTARQMVADGEVSDNDKIRRYSFDGFGSLEEYYGSGYVELLHFFGDLYDVESGEYLSDYEIVVMDRQYIISKRPNPSWYVGNRIFHAGWRHRQDNLYAMGPLDNLVGMQYRIDHLENLKADVFDMVAFPMPKIKGEVEDFEYGPGNRIYTGDEGDVIFMSPDVTALNADNQIALLEAKMEEMAGAPKQAMGFRTPGEKTAFEVQSLENASSRIFQNKVANFEDTFLDFGLNAMLEEARRNMDAADVIRTIDDETSAVLFQTVTREDITASGQLVPMGASHYARRNQITQNLMQLINSGAGQDPAINNHISGIRIAKMFEELLELNKSELVEANIRVREQADTEREIQSLRASLMEEEMAQPDLVAQGG